ncbi:metal-dependent hydrolase [Staphylococcus sp. SQ8-PEA]|uniref:Metal-dependent hydrolase n=1 Tax=Staphylococcus marylandisciuri TaxID=2981529 RepID=A0ABT2QM85_9STAP|nr:metal-dependent hydrolase [Staphylococcus marylandisciuri]MCU5745106.1 metal-dependent hydrolase [Staphylococcus marylandisciuri]
MTGKTHFSLGILVGASVATYYQEDVFATITIVALSALSSIFPDICHTKSKIGRRLVLLSVVFSLLVGHRTLTHSLLFVILIGVLLHILNTPIDFFLAITIGLCSHIFLDMLTPRGVKLLYPLPINVKFPVTFKTGGIVDLSLATALMIGSLYLLFTSYWQGIFINMLK